MDKGFIHACVIQFLLGLSWSTINILLVIYAATFDSPTLFGTLWSIIGLARFLAETPGGILVDRIGRRIVVLGGLTSVAISFIRFATAQTALDVLVASALAGAGFAVTHIGVMVQAADHIPPEERVRYMGLFNGSMMASNIVGPVIGGFVAKYFYLRASFIASTLAASAALLISILTIRDHQRSEGQVKEEGSSMLQDYRVFIRNRLYLILFLVSFCFALIVWSFGAMVFPNYGRNILSLTIAEIGLLTSINSIILFLNQFFLSGIMERRLSRRALISLGLLIYGAAAYSFSILSDFYSLAIAFIVLGMGLGTLSPSLEAIWIDITKTEERGRIFGLRIAFFDFGQVLFSVVMPIIMSLDSRLPFYAIALGALSIAVLMHLTFRGTRQTTESIGH